MTDQLIVLLENKQVGTITKSSTKGHATNTFAYNNDYLADESATPLSVSMPLSDQPFTDQYITPWLWNLLPDNPSVLDRWARQFTTSASSPFNLLASPVGWDCAGAVQFCEPDEVANLQERKGEVAWLSDSETNKRLRQLWADRTAWLGPTTPIGRFSLGGAQTKTALIRDHKSQRWGVPQGSTPTTHIIKPPIDGFAAQDLNEHLCLTAARRLGIAAARSDMLRIDENKSCIAVERFDRRIVNSEWQRLHQEDFCQALGLPPIMKYQSDGGPSFADLLSLLRSVLPRPAAERTIWRIVDAALYNWLIAGTDGHAKNYSLLLSQTQIQLAPLYDVASMLPYGDSNGRKLKLAMKVGDEYNLHRMDRATVWQRAATEWQVDFEQLRTRALDLCEKTPDVFESVATQTADDGHTSKLLTSLPKLVEQRAQSGTKIFH